MLIEQQLTTSFPLSLFEPVLLVTEYHNKLRSKIFSVNFFQKKLKNNNVEKSNFCPFLLLSI